MAKAEEIPDWKQKAFHDIQELGRKVIALNGGQRYTLYPGRKDN